MDTPHRTPDPPALPVRNPGEALAAGIYFATVEWTNRRLAAGRSTNPRLDVAEEGEDDPAPFALPDLMTTLEESLAAAKALRDEEDR